MGPPPPPPTHTHAHTLPHTLSSPVPPTRTDKGAIKFVLSGANIMCPGLTSPGATMHDEAPAGRQVAILAEGKELAMAVGYTTLSTAEVRCR